MRNRQISRVLMTGDTVGGVWTFCLELATALSSIGVEVALAAMGGEPSAAQRAEAARIPGLRLFSSSDKLEWMEDPWEDVTASGRWLLEIADRVQPDLVHLNSYGHGALAWNCPVVLTAHSCVLSWWRAVKREPLPAQWDRYRREVTRSIRSATVLTAPSLAMLDCIESHYGPGLPQYRAVVPNGRDSRRYRPLPKENFVLSAGRLWDEGKNAAAVAAVAGRLPWPVCLAGESSGFAGCGMLGRLSSDDLAAWYGRASIYALPARYEPFGLSVLEAALSGCALVLGDIPSLREIWGDAAIFVPPEDHDLLQNALCRLIEDGDMRNEMARRACERAREFTPDRMLRSYLAAYHAAETRMACAS